MKNEGNLQVGTPVVNGVSESEVVEHGKQIRLLCQNIFQRKDTNPKNGHRQPFTKNQSYWNWLNYDRN